MFIRTKQLINIRGFTLIEMLVVVVIISILLSVVLISISASSKRARDAIRLSDMRNLYIAFELFNSENGRYPNFAIDGIPNTGQQIGIGLKIDEVLSPYVSSVPADPLHNGTLYFYSYDPDHPVKATVKVIGKNTITTCVTAPVLALNFSESNAIKFRDEVGNFPSCAGNTDMNQNTAKGTILLISY